MKNPFGQNWKPEQTHSDKITIPAGVYVAGIIGAKSDDKALTIQVEITEGPLTGIYRKEYESQNSQYRAPKYKGTLVLRFPDGSSKQSDDFRERDFKGTAWAVEKSNPGYTWQWETLERDLKNKACGINVRERDWCMQDASGEWRTGTTTEIARLEDVNAVREGRVKVAKKRELSQRDRDRMQQSDAAEPAHAMEMVQDEELPF